MATMIQNEDGRMGPIHWYDSMQRAPVLVRAVANMVPGLTAPVLGSPEWAAAMSGVPQNWGYYFGDKEGGVWRFGARVKELEDKVDPLGGQQGVGKPELLPVPEEGMINPARATDKKPLVKLPGKRAGKEVPLASLGQGALFMMKTWGDNADIYIKTDEGDEDAKFGPRAKCVALNDNGFVGLLCYVPLTDEVTPVIVRKSMKVEVETERISGITAVGSFAGAVVKKSDIDTRAGE